MHLTTPRAVVSTSPLYVMGPPLSISTGSTQTHKILQWVFIAITIITTIAAMRYIRRKQRLVASDIVYQRRKRRQARLQAEEDARVDAAGITPVSFDTEQGIIAPVPRLPHS
jgi:hypothetical protein